MISLSYQSLEQLSRLVQQQDLSAAEIVALMWALYAVVACSFALP